MSLAHLDNPGAVRWFSGYGPAEVLGECPHSGCGHRGTGVVAWGPDLRHYELIECGIQGDDDGTDCAGNCRAWTDDRDRVTTPWLHVAVTADEQGVDGSVSGSHHSVSS